MDDKKSFSIIIPAHKDEKDFSLLKKLNEKFSEAEIILALDADNELTIETLSEINLHIKKLIKVPSSTRGKSLNAGALVSTKEYLWFLHIDSNIDDIGLEDLEKVKHNQLNYFKLAFDKKLNQINAAGANFRSNNFDLPFGDQSFLIKKDLFNLIGRFDETLKEGEDHKFVWNAKSLGVEIKEISKHIVSSARKYENNSFWQTIKTLFKTVTQAKEFKQNRVKNIFCFFMKDPFSKDSKTRLRRTLNNNQLVDDFNMHCLKIVKANIDEINNDDENKVVIINNSPNTNYLEKLGLDHFSRVDLNFDDVGKSMQATYDLCSEFTDNIVLVGSDIPELVTQHLNVAVKELKNYDSFFIPTNDNGFCCFSTKLKTLSHFFTRINYKSENVIDELTKNLYNYKKSDDTLIDVDTLNDLQNMYSNLANIKTINKYQKELINFIDKRKYS